jgi:hypothetical protein
MSSAVNAASLLNNQLLQLGHQLACTPEVCSAWSRPRKSCFASSCHGVLGRRQVHAALAHTHAYAVSQSSHVPCHLAHSSVSHSSVCVLTIISNPYRGVTSLPPSPLVAGLLQSSAALPCWLLRSRGSARCCTPVLHSHQGRLYGRGVARRCCHRSRVRPVRRRCLQRSRSPCSRAPRCPHPHPSLDRRNRE